MLISDGSELLLLVNEWKDIVGPVVLPILGAVPDGAMVLFSGLRENAQEELAIGVGALAGSTILLLTVPLFASVYAGRVDIRRNGSAVYDYRPRLFPPNSVHFTKTGVEPKPAVARAGLYMLVTAFSYVIIQGMAFFSGNYFSAQHSTLPSLQVAKDKHHAAVVVLLMCFAFFTIYIWRQVNPDEEDKAIEQAFKKGKISLNYLVMNEGNSVSFAGSPKSREGRPLLQTNSLPKLRDFLHKACSKFDENGDNLLSTTELGSLTRRLHFHLTPSDMDSVRALSNGNNWIRIDTLVDVLVKFTIQQNEKNYLNELVTVLLITPAPPRKLRLILKKA